MLKIKTLRFFIWNNGVCHEQYRDYCNKTAPYLEPDEIDYRVNQEIREINRDREQGAHVEDILINDVVISRHNNGGDDTIMRTYTIKYTVYD